MKIMQRMFIRCTTSIVADNWIGCSSHMAVAARAVTSARSVGNGSNRASRLHSANTSMPASRCHSRLLRL